jgi:hypothetical protein
MIMTFIKNKLFRCIRKFVFICIFSFIWDWGLTWVAPFVVLDVDWLLSFMDGLPLSVGGGGSDAGPSRRPLDLNVTPSPEPAPPAESETAPPPAESETASKLQETDRLLQEARGELKVWEGRLKAWEEEERQVKDRALQSLLLMKEIQKLGWKTFFSEMRRQGLKRAISEIGNRRG